MTGTAPSSDAPVSDDLQTQVRTFLIADVRGYTRFTDDHGDEAAARLAERFADLAESVVSARGGSVIELRGDEALAVFASARQALRAAVDLQTRVQERDHDALSVNVGVGLDAGEAIPVKGGYRGAALNLAARLCSLAGPGEVLASDTVANLARKIEGLEYAERGMVQLKGFADPVRVVEVRPSPPNPLSRYAGEGETDLRSLPSPASGTGVEGTQEGVRGLPIGGFLGALPEGMLVARDDELSRLLAALDVVEGGVGRLILLAGEPGVGKTRLAQEVTLEARNRGFLVATGRCYEPSQGIPFYPFLEALSNAFVAGAAPVRTAAAQRWPYLGRLLPDHLTPPSSPPSESQEEQERLFRAVTGFLVSLAESAPVALLLDDLQWADGSSLGLLQHLARHTRANPILLLGTYRDVEVDPDHPLEAVLLDLGRERLVERIAVRRLPGEGTAAMMVATLGAPDMSPELASLVHSRTEGNPFFVEEVVRSLVERGDVFRQGDSWALRDIEDIEVPESVRSVIARRVSRLDESAQEMLLAASVLGQTFTFDDVEALEGRSEEEMEAVLEDVTASGLIRETGRDTYSFNHALTQQALYARLPGRKRRRLHLAAGEALERLPEPARDRRAAELAWHFLEGDDIERASRYSVRAGDRAEEVFAHAEAERHYRTALELARELNDRPREAEALAKLGSVLSILVRYDEAKRLLEQSAELCRQGGDLHSEVKVALVLGGVHRGDGTAIEGIKTLLALLQRLENTGHTTDVADLLIALETLYFASGQYVDGLAAAEKAAELARQTGDQTILARAEVSRGTELSMLGRRAEGLRVLESAIPISESADDIYTLTRALINVSNMYYAQGRFGEAKAALGRALDIQERAHNTYGLAFALCNLGGVHMYLGEWQQAHAYLRRAMDMAATAPTAWWAAYPVIQTAFLYEHEGSWEDAAGMLHEAIPVAESNDDLQARRFGSMVLARVDLAQGHPAAARARLESLRDRPGLQEAEVTDMLPVLAWSSLDDGDLEHASVIVDEAIRRTTEEEKRLFLAEALLVKGRVRAAQNRWEDAREALEESLRHAREMPYPHLEARALQELGLVQMGSDDAAEAPMHLQEAVTIFHRLGAEPYAERIQPILNSLVDSAL